MRDSKEKVIIIGSGAAGLTAAIYAARANLKPLVIEGIQPGGQLTITTDVENYPGYADVVQGPWMMEQMRLQAEKVGARIISDIVTSVDFKKNNKIINLDSGKTLETQTVIITTGAQAKWLGLKSENDFNGKGVSACATCDGFFYKNKEVAVVGGGNTAVEEALYLSNICSKVTLIHRRNEIINVDGVFVAIGHSPSTEAFADVLDMDDEGYIIAQKPGTCLTNIDGVFAAGDCVDKVYRQAVTAAGMGCMAALDAEKWIQNQ